VPKYELVEPVSAVANDSEGTRIIHIPRGVVLEIPDSEKASGLVDAVLAKPVLVESVDEGARVSVFIQDVRQRSKLIQNGTGV